MHGKNSLSINTFHQHSKQTKAFLTDDTEFTDTLL